MDVWKKAHNLSVKAFRMTANLPRSEDYALTSQIRRSSNSVAANIAEAFGRRTSKDKNYFYTVSRGSGYETQNHLLYGFDIDYFKLDDVEQLIVEYDDLIHQLNKIMNKLERS
jgi:four helix bundle protein